MPDTIICPNCQTPIELTEVLSAQLRGQLRQEFEAEIHRREKALADREQKLTSERQALEQAGRDIEQKVAERLEGERKQLTAAALTKAREQVTVELRDKEQQLTEIQGKLKAAQDAELALRQDRHKLQEERNTLELTLTRRLDEERSKIRETAKKEADEERRLKDAEKDSLINTLRTQIEDLRRKSEQGSQQLQGEVLEVALEELLRRYFPFDEITPVAKGIHGGDVVQTVRDATGAVAGQILWESKRTKNWSDGWLPKLRDDQRAAKAQVAILVTIELPQGSDHIPPHRRRLGNFLSLCHPPRERPPHGPDRNCRRETFGRGTKRQDGTALQLPLRPGIPPPRRRNRRGVRHAAGGSRSREAGDTADVGEAGEAA